MRTFYTLIVVLVLGTSCTVVYPQGRDRDKLASPARVEDIGRRALEPGDIPAPFKGCTGAHSATSRMVLDETRSSAVYRETNTRSCPDARLN